MFLGLSRVPVSPYIHNNAISVRLMREGIYISHAIYISGRGMVVVRLRFHAGLSARVCVLRRRVFIFSKCPPPCLAVVNIFTVPRESPFPHPSRRCLPQISKKKKDQVCPTICHVGVRLRFLLYSIAFAFTFSMTDICLHGSFV